MSEMLLALYDLRSKQEYIYRTNKIREISGGSALLANIYDEFLASAEEEGMTVHGKGKEFSLEAFKSSGCDMETVYNGGGNLMTIYRDDAAFVRANKIFSRLLFDKTYTVGAIVSKTAVTGNFREDRKKLYAENALRKNTGAVSFPCSVMPFSQVDSRTFMPVTYKEDNDSICREAELKREQYEKQHKKEQPDPEVNTIYLDDMAFEKGKESLLAIIYIDGNSMGEQLKDALGEKQSYDDCIKKLRDFSKTVNECFVDKPIEAVESKLRELLEKKPYAQYRKVIAGGDEITMICSAREVPDILDVYFKTLDSVGSNKYACAGVSIFHSHAPYADMYEIAEQCCESGKKISHKCGGKINMIDFHFCRAGVTNDMETISDRQEREFTARPYRAGEGSGVSFDRFLAMGETLKEIKRANIKTLASAMIDGDSYYKAELERIRSRFPGVPLDDSEETKKLIFDVAQVYDLWFADEEKEG